MGRRASTFRERDVTCALRAVRNAGCDVIRVSIARRARLKSSPATNLCWKRGHDIAGPTLSSSWDAKSRGRGLSGDGRDQISSACRRGAFAPPRYCRRHGGWDRFDLDVAFDELKSLEGRPNTFDMVLGGKK